MSSLDLQWKKGELVVVVHLSIRRALGTRKEMSRYILLTAAAVWLLLFQSCDESFSSSAPFQPRMVVYSVLTTESDTQYVRVYCTYNPPDNDPSKNQDEQSVTDAAVTISSDEGLHQFQKIVVQRPDTSRYASNIIAYVSYPFRPTRGRTYRLNVSSPTLGFATGATTVPGVAQISPSNFVCLVNPYVTRDENYGLNVYLSGQAKAFLARIYVDYLAPTPRGFQARRRQVPILVRPNSTGTYETYELVYPVVKRRQSTNPKYPDAQTFPAEGWYDMLENVIAFEDGGNSLFVQAVFQVIQFDAPLYNYYGVANSARDSLSIRLDERDYTNIYRGVGVFGSLAVDSSVSALPQHIFH